MKVGTHLRKRKDGSTKLCKFKKTATVKALELYLLKQDCFHDVKSRLTSKNRKGAAQAKMKDFQEEGKKMKRDHQDISTRLANHME